LKNVVLNWRLSKNDGDALVSEDGRYMLSRSFSFSTGNGWAVSYRDSDQSDWLRVGSDPDFGSAMRICQEHALKKRAREAARRTEAREVSLSWRIYDVAEDCPSTGMLVHIRADDHGIFIQPEGTGAEGCNAEPIIVELYDGTPRLLCWPNIDSSYVEEIDLSGALLSRLQDAESVQERSQTGAAGDERRPPQGRCSSHEAHVEWREE